MISKAVAKTKDTIATYDGKPIIGFYHSNSGGQTVLPQDVWSKNCRIVGCFDPFSKKRAITWPRHSLRLECYLMDAEFDWKPFRIARRQTPTLKTKFGNNFAAILSFVALLYPVVGSNIHLEGFGFGHGVGMSQQGAMRMALGGFSWKEILDFYFQNSNSRLFKNSSFPIIFWDIH